MTDHDAREAIAQAAERIFDFANDHIRQPSPKSEQDFTDPANYWHRAAVASLPAPTPAVAWRRAWNFHGRPCPEEFTHDAQIADLWRGHPQTNSVTPLYAAPQPPAQCANIAQKSEIGGVDPELIARVEEISKATGRDRWKVSNLTGYDWRRILAALANHSPDARGVGENALELALAFVRKHCSFYTGTTDIGACHSPSKADWQDFAAKLGAVAYERGEHRPGLRAGEE